jgi:hypothetical protein
MAYKKCLLCGEPILPTEQFVPYKTRYAHQHCFDSSMKQLAQAKKSALNIKTEQKKDKTTKKQPQAVLKEGMSEEDYALKKRYYNYLKNLLVDEQLTIKQVVASERFIERYNFTFEGMYQTLVYINEILGKELTGDIVGIIPYYYSEANSFNQDLKNIEENNKKINLKQLYPEKIIYVHPHKKKINTMKIEDIGN